MGGFDKSVVTFKYWKRKTAEQLGIFIHRQPRHTACFTSSTGYTTITQNLLHFISSIYVKFYTEVHGSNSTGVGGTEVMPKFGSIDGPHQWHTKEFCLAGVQ
jgi:hypothetical protein